MKTSYLFGAALAASSLASVVQRAEAVAATAAAFTFETSGVVLASATATGSTYGLLADVGVGSLLVSHGSAGTAATYTSPIGNGSARGFSSTNWSAPDSYIFSVSTVGVSDIIISFDMTASATGPKLFAAQSSNNGVNYTGVGGYNATFLSSTGFGAASDASFHFSFDFSAFTTLNNNSLATFRLQNQDGSFNRTNGGTNFIDNFIVTGNAVPEPASMGLALVAVGGLLNRRNRR